MIITLLHYYIIACWSSFRAELNRCVCVCVFFLSLGLWGGGGISGCISIGRLVRCLALPGLSERLVIHYLLLRRTERRRMGYLVKVCKGGEGFCVYIYYHLIILLTTTHHLSSNIQLCRVYLLTLFREKSLARFFFLVCLQSCPGRKGMRRAAPPASHHSITHEKGFLCDGFGHHP